MTPDGSAKAIRAALPDHGLFAALNWRIAPAPFRLEPAVAKELATLGRVLLQFNRAVNRLYRHSLEGKQPRWVAEWLDRGKPADLLALQHDHVFRNELPRVIRPDILLTEEGLAITELDAVPGGIGLTAWLNRTYSGIRGQKTEDSGQKTEGGGDEEVIGGSEGMIEGFGSIFGRAGRVHIVVSEEAATYRPEMEWLAGQVRTTEFHVRDTDFTDFKDGDAVYRFFELFDLANVAAAKTIFESAAEGRIQLTPPPKPVFEEKLLFALLWNRNLRGFWHRELGEGFFRRLLAQVPYTWVVDPTPLPPHGAVPELNLTDWQQLKLLSQRERNLILKVSGFNEIAWGARSVSLGSDLSVADWSAAVDEALRRFPESPYVLQRYHKPRTVESAWFDFDREELVPMAGRVRLCPYYFVAGEGDAARARLGGVLATICPADKKIIHGMGEAILSPCCVSYARVPTAGG